MRELELDETSVVDIGQILDVLWRGKWMIFLVTALCVLGAVQLALSLPNQYTASARLLITPDRGPMVGLPGLDSAPQPSEFLVESKAFMVLSNRVLERVVVDLELDQNESLIGEIEQETVAETGLDLANLRKRLAMKAINELLTVRPAGNSYTIMVEATTENPTLSSSIANSVAQEFVAMEKEAKVAEAQEANAWILARLDQLQERVDASSRSLESFRIQSGDLNAREMSDLVRLLDRLRTETGRGEVSEAARLQIQRGEEELEEMSQQMIELRELERQARADQSLYERLLGRARELQELETLQVADSRVFADALPPLEKSGPPRKLIVILGAILGFALGIVLVAIRQMFARPKGDATS